MNEQFSTPVRSKPADPPNLPILVGWPACFLLPSKTASLMFLKSIFLKSSCFKGSENVVKLSGAIF